MTDIPILQTPTNVSNGPPLIPVLPISPNSSSGGQVPPPCGGTQNGFYTWDNVPCTTTIVPTLDMTPTDFNIDAISDGVMTQYLIEQDYFWDEHVIQMPVMSTEVTSASFANLANETLKRVVYWTAQKLSVPPTMPQPDLNGSNSKLLEKKFSPLSVELAADGATPVYTIKGMYVYGIVDPTQETMYFGVPPYVDMDYDATQLGDYQGGLIDSEQTPS